MANSILKWVRQVLCSDSSDTLNVVQALWQVDQQLCRIEKYEVLNHIIDTILACTEFRTHKWIKRTVNVLSQGTPISFLAARSLWWLVNHESGDLFVSALRDLKVEVFSTMFGILRFNQVNDPILVESITNVLYSVHTLARSCRIAKQIELYWVCHVSPLVKLLARQNSEHLLESTLQLLCVTSSIAGTREGYESLQQHGFQQILGRFTPTLNLLRGKRVASIAYQESLKCHRTFLEWENVWSR